MKHILNETILSPFGLLWTEKKRLNKDFYATGYRNKKYSLNYVYDDEDDVHLWKLVKGKELIDIQVIIDDDNLIELLNKIK